jgi:hypothetical protein
VTLALKLLAERRMSQAISETRTPAQN